MATKATSPETLFELFDYLGLALLEYRHGLITRAEYQQRQQWARTNMASFDEIAKYRDAET